MSSERESRRSYRLPDWFYLTPPGFTLPEEYKRHINYLVDQRMKRRNVDKETEEMMRKSIAYREQKRVEENLWSHEKYLKTGLETTKDIEKEIKILYRTITEIVKDEEDLAKIRQSLNYFTDALYHIRLSAEWYPYAAYVCENLYDTPEKRELQTAVTTDGRFDYNSKGDIVILDERCCGKCDLSSFSLDGNKWAF